MAAKAAALTAKAAEEAARSAAKASLVLRRTRKTMKKKKKQIASVLKELNEERAKEIEWGKKSSVVSLQDSIAVALDVMCESNLSKVIVVDKKWNILGTLDFSAILKEGMKGEADIRALRIRSMTSHS